MEVRSRDVYEDCFDSGGGCGGDVGGEEYPYRCVCVCGYFSLKVFTAHV